MEDLRSQLTKLTQTLSVREPGKFPSQPYPNPAGQAHRVEASTSQSHKQVQSITILRSGKEIEKPKYPGIMQPTASEPDPEEVSSEESEEPIERKKKEGNEEQSKKEKDVKERSTYEPRPHFPQKLAQSKKSKINAEMYEVFKQVRINIPLLDAIKQTPSYAKFLKDLCIVKRKINIHGKTFLTEQVSSILQFKTPP